MNASLNTTKRSALQDHHDGRLELALLHYNLYVAECPDDYEMRRNRGLLLLALGKYEDGWRDFEYRYGWHRPMPPYEAPIWDGNNIEGRRVLLWCEEGRGDSIMFSRYAQCVAQGGQKVVLHCPTEQVRLLGTAVGVEKASDDIDALGEYDCHAPLMSLPLLTKRFSPEQSPTSGPYLKAEPYQSSPPGFNVGVCWAGNPKNTVDPSRSCPPSMFQSLKCRKYALSPYISLEEANRAGANRVWNDWLRRYDLADAASYMSQLSLVITVDTVTAHLAGALGIPVCILLSQGGGCPCWRWGREGNTTPWYGSARLYRQTAPGDWEGVFQKVAADLEGYERQ